MFFRPVAIHIRRHAVSGFSRELAETGIGLPHNANLSPGEVDIAIATEQGFLIRIRTRIVWCEPCGEGWYVSGELVGTTRIGK
jgi:hypothetical protein